MDMLRSRRDARERLEALKDILEDARSDMGKRSRLGGQLSLLLENITIFLGGCGNTGLTREYKKGKGSGRSLHPHNSATFPYLGSLMA